MKDVYIKIKVQSPLAKDFNPKDPVEVLIPEHQILSVVIYQGDRIQVMQQGNTIGLMGKPARDFLAALDSNVIDASIVPS